MKSEGSINVLGIMPLYVMDYGSDVSEIVMIGISAEFCQCSGDMFS